MIKKVSTIVIVIATMTALAGAGERTQAAACSHERLAALRHIATPAVYALAKAGCAATGNDAALGLLEEAMRMAAPDARTFGMLQSIYWPTVEDTHQGLRAASFFRSLTVEHPNDPEVLAAAGNALGIALPELNAAGAPPAVAARWSAQAQSDYAKALKIDPDNFSARLGQAIFLSYIPGRFSECNRQFEKLLTLRTRYPNRHYPWGMVYVQWARAASRNGQPERARQILEKGRATVPGDPVLAHATIH